MLLATGASGERRVHEENSIWMPLGADGNAANWYINSSSIKEYGGKSINNASVWFMVGRVPIKQPKTKNAMLSMKQHLRIDCNNYKIMKLYSIFYSESMGEGNITLSDSYDNDEWVIASKGTALNVIFEVVCKIIEEERK